MLRIETIIAAAMRHREVAGSLGDALRNDLVVSNPLYRNILEFYMGFWEERRMPPKNGDVELWLQGIPDAQRGSAKESWHRLMHEDLTSYTPEYLAEQALPALQQAATRNALARLNATTDLTPDLLHNLNEQVESVQSIGLQDLADIRDVERWAHNEELEWTIPTGIPSLDRYIGGWSEELVFVLADSGVGKTTFLINTGQHGALIGKKVFHITFELSKARTMHRYYRRITETDLPSYRSNIDRLIKEAKHWLSHAKGQLHVHYEPAYTVDPVMLGVLVDRYAQKFGGVDMIVVDYLDLMIPTRRSNRSSLYEDLGRITHEVRALCPEYNCTVISAAQATRAQGRTRLHMADMSDSYGKVRGAGIIGGLVQTEEEADNHQGRFGLLKVRDNPGRGVEIPLFIDLDRMMFADLDHPNTLRIMREQGYLPRGAEVDSEP